MQQLLKLSVWADLRNGDERAYLLISVAPRLGFCRVVVPTTGPLAGAAGLAERIVASAPTSTRVESRGMALPLPTDRRRFGPVVDVPVSIGRTQAEAVARAASDPVFAVVGTPQLTGLFGRLEDVQAQVAVLAAAGVSELCCILPAEDLLDHLAQLATVAVGHPDTHAPGLERSPDPPPPAGWGAPSAAPPSER